MDINHSRLSIPEYALMLAEAAATRSEDPYTKVGCCILNKEGAILSTGYNGLKSKVTVNDNFWADRDNRLKYMLHSEINALSWLKKSEQPYLIAITHSPCMSCAQAIVANGIQQVYYRHLYERDQVCFEIFGFYKIFCRQIENEN